MKIFITGGAGYLGKAIMKFGHEYWPDPEYTIYSRDEAKQASARARFPQTRCILGDILDRTLLTESMKGHDIVIHAAAMKYVPQAEINPWYASEVNIQGSRNVISAACGAHVGKVIGISTDKACSPVNVYGMTKLVMERLFVQANDWGDTKFNVVRYGNVIASTGSVIPIFRHQIRSNGEVRITDPAMTRFWLTIQKAVQLIAEATGDIDHGIVLISRCPATSIREVAEACVLIEEAGKADSIIFKTTGVRFGEKKHEELLTPLEVQYAHDNLGGNTILYSAEEASRTGVPLHSRGVYTSNTPDHWIKADEMANLIREAESYESTT